MSDDEGSAALEFVTVGVILLVPLVYLVIVLGAIQEQAWGTEAAARHTARAIALAADAQDAGESADAVIAGIIDDYGMDAGAMEVSLSCRPAGVDCPSAGATLEVTVTAVVRMPFVPAVLGLDEALAVPLEATSVQKVGRDWGSG